MPLLFSFSVFEPFDQLAAVELLNLVGQINKRALVPQVRSGN